MKEALRDVAAFGTASDKLSHARIHICGLKSRTRRSETSHQSIACPDALRFAHLQKTGVVCCSAKAEPIVEDSKVEGVIRALPPQTTLLESRDAEDEETSSRQHQAGSSDLDGRPPTQAGRSHQSGSGHRNAYPLRSRQSKYMGPSSERQSMRRNFTLDKLQPAAPQQKSGPIRNFPFREGDEVVGTVIGGRDGWRVALDYDQEIVGFCPLLELPHVLKDKYKHSPNYEDTILGTRRVFMIMDFPREMEYNGRGPRLSARAPDTTIIWRRAEQMRDVCQEDNDVVSISVATSNNGGLLGFMDGLPLFIPWSYLPRANLGGMPKEDLVSMFVGQDVVVSVQDVNRAHNRFVGNMIEAMNNNAYHRLKIGDLVWGRVNALAPYGVFVTLDPYPSVRALLHIASISQNHVTSSEDLFSEGDRVRCAVIGIDQEARQLSLSTAELENYPGEMLQNKEAVFDHAEESIKDYLAFVEEQRKAGFPAETARGNNSGNGKRNSNDSLNW